MTLVLIGKAPAAANRQQKGAEKFRALMADRFARFKRLKPGAPGAAGGQGGLAAVSTA
jgi:hypothetical protein